MTIHLSLDDLNGVYNAISGPSRSAQAFPHPDLSFRQLITSLRSCQRLVVVCGAGISTAASIPDFRSASGLFTGKGKAVDLFHIKALSSPLHYQLITQLASLSHAADPTPFHTYLHDTDQAGRLLRVYTQNIDGLEEKAGLSIGINPPSRVIALHGTLSTLHCSLCSAIVPTLPHLPLQHPIPCPTCNLSSTIRSALSERQRRVGSLRISAILYGEEHPQGESIGQIVQRDLKGKGKSGGKVDFLLVAGTSLAIPGVKRIVKEMAKSLHARGTGIKTVFINDTPPPKTSEWADVFDVWIQGDIQAFINDYLSNTAYTSLPSTPRKRKVVGGLHTPITPDNSSDFTARTKRSKRNWLPTPRATPPSPSKWRRRSRSPATRHFEGSLTPLSDADKGEMENPFLDLGKRR